MKFKPAVFPMVLFFLLLFSETALSETRTISWDPVTTYTDNTPIDPGKTVFYTAYWTTDPELGSLRFLRTSLTATSTTFDPNVQGMTRGGTVFFTGKASLTTGEESDLSPGYKWVVPNSFPSPHSKISSSIISTVKHFVSAIINLSKKYIWTAGTAIAARRLSPPSNFSVLPEPILAPPPPPPRPPAQSCGDGICDDDETTSNCPMDCGPSQSPIPNFYWNAWADNVEGPWFTPVPYLKPDKLYRLSLDLALLQYRAAGVIASPIGPGIQDQMKEWIKPNMPPQTLNILMLPDTGMFDAAPEVKDFPVNIDRLRKIWDSGVVGTDYDAFRILRENDPIEKDFKIGGTFFNLITRDRVGPAAVAFSIWYLGRPIDEVSVQFCIANSDEEAKKKCKGRQNPIASQGLASVHAASDNIASPEAAFHFIELGKGARITGVFRKRTWAKDRFLVWQLKKVATEFRRAISDEVLKDIASGKTDANLLFRGETFFMKLFPKDAKSWDGERVHDNVIKFLRPYLKQDPSAKDYIPPSIFVRMIQVGPPPSLPIPLGLLAVKLDENEEMTIENGRFLGDYFRIESPLEFQAYNPSDNCLSRWVMVLPPGDTSDDAINNARNQYLGSKIAQWFENKEALPYENMTKFRGWLNQLPSAESEDPPTALVTLSHQDRNSLYFYKTDNLKDNPLKDENINQKFAQSSIAILNGCGTGGEGAVDLIRRFNEKGFTTIIGASSEIDGNMAGAFLNVFANEISSSKSEKQEPLGLVFWRSIRKLRDTKAKGVQHSMPFGAKAHLFSLLGNGEVLLCAPKKENRPPDKR